MSTSKRSNKRRWQKTLAVTGLVTGGLVLGTLGNVHAQADAQTGPVTSDSTAKTAENVKTNQNKVAGKLSAPTQGDQPSAGTPAAGQAGTQSVAGSKVKPDESNGAGQTPVVSSVAQENDTAIKPATVYSKRLPGARAMPEVASLDDPTTTNADDESIDSWMPDKNMQLATLGAFNTQRRQAIADGETALRLAGSDEQKIAAANAQIEQGRKMPEYTAADVSQITKAKMATLTKFDPAYPRNGDIERDAIYQATLKLTDLTGLQYATQLKELFLSPDDPNADVNGAKAGKDWQRSSFSDLSQLSKLGLTNLTSLDVSQTSVSDLTPVMRFADLRSIFANHALIKTLKPTGASTAGDPVPFSQLTRLEVDDNQLTSLDGLEGATQLANLTAQNNTILNINGIANVKVPMGMLYLGGNAIRDLTPLAGKTISTLYVNGQQVVLSPDEAVSVDTSKDMVTTDSPILNQTGIVPITAYLGGSIAQTSLRADPTDQAATKITWRGVASYGKKYLIATWYDGNFTGVVYMPYKLKTPATTTTPVTTGSKGDNVTTKPVKPLKPTKPGKKTNKTAFRPFMIYTKQALYRYTKPTFNTKQRVKHYRRYTRQTAPTFKVVGVKRSANGRLRYKLANGSFVTARKAFVYNLYWQGKHYTKIKLDRTVYEYKQPKFAKVNRQKRLKKGTIVTVKRIVHRGYMTRYQLSNGHYITGNKQFITPRR